MKSIKLYLVIAIVSVMTLTLFLAALRGYQASIRNMEELFDLQLQDSAQIILTLYSPSAPTHIIPSPEHSAHQGVLFQVWRNNDTVVAANTDLQQPLSGFEDGYSVRNFLGYRWRIYSTASADGSVRVMVAERADLRYQMADLLVAESILPVVINVPIAGLIIWWIIGRGLSLLKRLAGDLSEKRAEDLSPLDYRDVPRELTVVVDSINTLFTRLQQAFDREKHFASDAAHELRTPISALKVHIHNLKHQLPDRRAELASLEVDINRLSHLVEQILLLYRTNPENVVFRETMVNLTELIQSAVSDMYEAFEVSNQDVALLVEHPEMVRGDANFLGILVRNLISNANKYAPEGGRIEVDIQRRENTLKLLVADSGEGIPEQDYQRVFDRFYRVGGDRHASGKAGCGLGLSIVRHIAELHDAKVGFERQIREGQQPMFAVTVEFSIGDKRR